MLTSLGVPYRTALLFNGVSLYSYNPWSLVNGPLLLELPPYVGGYWLLPFYDIHGIEFLTLGSAHGDNGGGQWLLVHKDWQAPEGVHIPENVTVVVSPTVEGSFLGRTSLNGTGAVDYNLAWKFGLWNPTGAPLKVAWPPVGQGYGYPDTTVGAWWAINPSDPLAFWRVAGEVLRRNGGETAVPQPLLRELPKLGLNPDYGFLSWGLGANVTDALAYAPYLASRIAVAKFTFLGTPANNYWYRSTNFATWGTDYVLAAAVQRSWWNPVAPADAVYYYATFDSDGNLFNGTNDYSLTFATPPPATGGSFWSVQSLDLDNWTLVGPGASKAALSSAAKALYVAADGSIPIRLSSTAPPANSTAADRGWNWVASYPGHFQVVLRVYVPTKAVADNVYVPEAIKKI